MSSAFAFNEDSVSDFREFMNVIDARNISSLYWVHISNYDLMLRRNEVISPYKYSWKIKIEPYVCDVKGALPYIY